VQTADFRSAAVITVIRRGQALPAQAACIIPAQGKEGEMPADDDWKKFMSEMEALSDVWANGDPEPIKDLWSHADDVTLFGGQGDSGLRGWTNVGSRIAWASAQIPGQPGPTTRDRIAEYVGDDFAFTADVEHRSRVQPDGTVRHTILRVTQIYRREDGRWRIMHRHANPVSPDQRPNS
jgi:ketosteroid isomerase-like protein